MEYIYSVEEATQKLYAELTEATGFKKDRQGFGI